MEEFKYKKSLGQNFLRDNNIIEKIIDSAEIDKDTLVIEIGPGRGALSTLIASKALQYENASFPIEITDLGMLIDVNLLQLENEDFPIEITESGMIIVSKELQL